MDGKDKDLPADPAPPAPTGPRPDVLTNYSMDLGASHGPEYAMGWYNTDKSGRPTFDPTKFLTAFINRYAVTKVNGRVVATLGPRYFWGEDALDGLITYMDAGLLTAQRNEVLRRLRSYFATRPEDGGEAPPRYIRFRTQVMDILTGALINPEAVPPIFNIVPWDYDPGAYNADVDRMLNDLTDGSRPIRDLLEEMIGYCLYRSLKFRKMFVLQGPKRNGKSTFLEMLNYALGDKNTSNLGLQDYSEQFLRPQLFGKLVNLGDDISDRYIPETDILKKLVSGEPVQAAEKYEKPFIFRSYATSIFSSNKMPKTADPTGAVMDRIIIIPFNHVFSEATADLTLLDRMKVPSGAQYLLRLGVAALQRLLREGQFIQPPSVQEAHQEMVQDNDHIKDWLSQFSPMWQQSEAVWQSYLAYCVSENIKSSVMYTKRGLTRAINGNLCFYIHKYSNAELVFEPVSTRGRSREEIQQARWKGWDGQGKFPEELINKPPEDR